MLEIIGTERGLQNPSDRAGGSVRRTRFGLARIHFRTTDKGPRRVEPPDVEGDVCVEHPKGNFGGSVINEQHPVDLLGQSLDLPKPLMTLRGLIGHPNRQSLVVNLHPGGGKRPARQGAGTRDQQKKD